MRLYCFAAMLAFVAIPAAAQQQDYFQQFVHYTIDVSLDTERHSVGGAETIAYVNNSPDTLREFYLHLYPNAFKDRHSPFMKEYRQRFNLNLVDLPGAYRSHLDISDVTVDGAPVNVRVDGTIAHIRLLAPLPPGQSLTLEMKFAGKVGKHFARSGYSGDHYDFAQWYPKVVVYDEKGFHPDQYSAKGEFYGEFGTFDVRIELPEHFVVAATGTVASGDPGWDYNPPGEKGRADKTDRRKTVHFHAENVHDFAWSADPTFVVESTTWNGTDVHSVYRRANANSWADTTLTHAVRAMQWFDRRVGRYPYPQVTVVDALLNGGMEYPMLVMDGRADEDLVVHEIGHIYFYGILANNELDAAWLDESLAEFMTNWYVENRFGPYGDKSQWSWYKHITPQYKLWEEYRSHVFKLARRNYGERVASRAGDFKHSYYTHVYYKGSLVMNALRYALEEEQFEDVLKEYYTRWQLKHVNEERFRNVVEDATGVDLRLQFDQWLHTRKTVDYELARVRTRTTENGALAAVDIRRHGELFLPIQVDFTLADGTVESRRIDGKLRTIKQTFELPSVPVQTAINPDNEIMDINLSNNFQPRRRRFQIDWPNNHYYPEDAYQIRHRPGFWYNDIDGLKAGYHFSGSLHNWKRRLQLGVYYGAESDRVDYKLKWEEPHRVLNLSSNFLASMYKMEGRQDFTISLRVVHRPELMRPPTQEFIVGYRYHELTRPEYLTSSEIYDTAQADVGPFFAYSIGPEVDFLSTKLSANLGLGRKWFGGKFKYERLALTLTAATRRKFVPVDARLRLFTGVSGGGAPTQQKFQLGGAGPLQAEERFWLRSPGAVWDDLNYHEPGDGNLRGYRVGTFGVNKLVAFNSEVGTGLPLFGKHGLLHPIVGNVSWYAFYDVGAILDSENPIGTSARVTSLVDQGVLGWTLFDAGIGFRSRVAWPFWDLTWRLDIPFHVSHPELNGETERTQFRYLFSLATTF